MSSVTPRAGTGPCTWPWPTGDVRWWARWHFPPRTPVLSTAEPPLRDEAAASGVVRLAVSRRRPPKFVEALAAELGAETVPTGSAGAKIAAVILGEVDAYVHAGGQYEWDSAAPVAVARAAGLYTARIDGSELFCDRADSWLPDLVVCRDDLGERMRVALSRSIPESGS
ncbi:3'(2'), 5'-bisphosphate nucleotidase [Saccharopolyspora lacisalsi]|uniref:3'(2'), 5'-bisphosphate nucleotidase n=1 Tax=Halosaccharopolyspora lacisalsi TaxID=1000566 RepID=A0A839DZA3_9PSEU|nr:3'(2'), 5'-bisphosphate nucleotidase [Halosaccharopolyspora lacisalsi]